MNKRRSSWNALTQEQFVSKANIRHHGMYDYTKSDYKNCKTKIEIICPVHGSFFQSPGNHLSGKGCQKCHLSKLHDGEKLTLDEFVKKSRTIHGVKYDYSKVDYHGTKHKVIIMCPIHGEFEQLPSNHFKYGCYECSLATRENHLKTLEDFIAAANKKHSAKYDYTGAIYRGAHRKVYITCQKHGIFRQTPNSHLRGRGCPECKKGVNHPHFGKPAIRNGYNGLYKGNIFRSVPELFWMIEAEKKGINFLSLDQTPRRTEWQVHVTYGGKPHTYCADFYIYDTNEVIDIKPVWKQKMEEEKLREGAREYIVRGYQFKLVDTNEIKTSRSLFKKMVRNKEVELYPAAQKRFDKRFG